MIRLVVFLCSVISFFSIETLAQVDTVAKNNSAVKYFNNVLSGGLFGEEGQGNSLSLSTTHGVRWKRLGGGVGVSYDSYSEWRVLPYYGVASFDFAQIKSNTLFCEAGLGYSKVWHVPQNEWMPEYETKGGRTLTAMAGYRIHVNKYSLYIKAGYKFQRVRYTYDFNFGGWEGNPGWTNRYSVKYDIERIAVQIGFGWH